MKVLCLGHIAYDITFPIEKTITENTKTRIFQKTECVGGSASIAALLLSKWDINTYMAGIVGNDEWGKKVITEFSRNRIHIESIQINKDIETSHSFILANRLNGSRTAFTYVPKKIHLKKFDLSYKPDIILIDGNDFEASKYILQQNPKSLTIIDADQCTPEVIELSSLTNYLICSQSFAESCTNLKIDVNNKKDILHIYKLMEQKFNNNIIITLGNKGSVYRIANEIKIMPSIKVKTIDSTCAGDIFHGAFVYGITQKFSLEKTLKYSSIAAALSVTKLGGYNSIPSLEEVETVYNEIK